MQKYSYKPPKQKKTDKIKLQSLYQFSDETTLHKENTQTNEEILTKGEIHCFKVKKQNQSSYRFNKSQKFPEKKTVIKLKRILKVTSK